MKPWQIINSLSMASKTKCRLLTLFLAFLMTNAWSLKAQPLTIEWQRGYNAHHVWNGGEAISSTADGGYIMAGFANTITNWGADLWVVKLDETGNVIWEKSFAGNSPDVAKSVIQTADGGYIVLGQTNSANADASGNHGNSDLWVIKLDEDGTLAWKKCYGGGSFEIPGNIVQNTDGTYTIAATSFSNDGDLAGVPLPATNILNWPFSYNVWLFKLNSSGNIIWQKAYGGPWHDYGNDIKLLADGGYLVTGSTTSEGGDVSGRHGPGPQNLSDIWVFRTNASGTLLWQKCLGGFQPDEGNASIITSDGGIAVVGNTFSPDGDVTGYHSGGWADAWLAKLDATGNLLWQKCIGGSNPDQGMNVIEYEGKLLVSVTTLSNDGDVTTRIGGSTDLLLAAVSLNGTSLWQQCYGGNNRDGEVSSHLDVNTIGLTIADDGGLAMVSQSTSSDIPYVTNDMWSSYMIKFKPETCDTITDKKDMVICNNTVWPLALDLPEHSGTYLWNTGATTSSVMISDTGTYWCIHGKKCPKLIDTFVVTYKPDLPQPDLGDSFTLCFNTTRALGTELNNVTYSWNTGARTCCIVPKQPGMYSLTISDECTSLQDSVYVVLADCNNCIFIPNAFSPNRDGLNDEFGVIPYCRISNYKFNIFNRWGGLVFSTPDTNKKWDGNFKGLDMPVGTYFYNISYQNQDQEMISKKGDFQLIR
jgi:gliding motility-associated-like protein